MVFHCFHMCSSFLWATAKKAVVSSRDARIGFVPEPFSQKFGWIFAAGFKSPAGMLGFPTKIYETWPEISVIDTYPFNPIDGMYNPTYNQL